MTRIAVRRRSARVVETEHPFEDLPNGDQRLAKAKLAARIIARIKESGIKQKEAAALLGITQPEVSNLSLGRLSGFTFDRLYRCLNALDMDIEISVKERPRRARAKAGIRVEV